MIPFQGLQCAHVVNTFLQNVLVSEENEDPIIVEASKRGRLVY